MLKSLDERCPMTQQFTRVSAVATSLKEAVRLSTESYVYGSLSLRGNAIRITQQ